MTNTIQVIGAGGHARAVISLIKKTTFSIGSIYDDNFSQPEEIMDTELVGDLTCIPENSRLILAIGSNTKRKELFNKYKDSILMENIIHPSANLEAFTTLGMANLIFANVVMNGNVTIGNNNIINTAAILEHEAIIGSHNHISVRATLLGRVNIGNNCFIGAGAIVKDGVKICDNVTIGANSFVFENITEPGTYIGSPARRIK